MVLRVGAGRGLGGWVIHSRELPGPCAFRRLAATDRDQPGKPDRGHDAASARLRPIAGRCVVQAPARAAAAGRGSRAVLPCHATTWHELTPMHNPGGQYRQPARCTGLSRPAARAAARSCPAPASYPRLRRPGEQLLQQVTRAGRPLAQDQQPTARPDSRCSATRDAQAGEHSAAESVNVGAKTRERRRGSGVPEIPSRALLTCLTAPRAHAGRRPAGGPHRPVSSGGSLSTLPSVSIANEDRFAVPDALGTPGQESMPLSLV
jgi:hypothetical protein